MTVRIGITNYEMSRVPALIVDTQMIKQDDLVVVDTEIVAPGKTQFFYVHAGQSLRLRMHPVALVEK